MNRARLFDVIVKLWPLVSMMLVVVFVTALGRGASTVIQRNVLFGLCYLTIVVSLYLFIGNTGVISIGHVAFVAVGAYTSGILTVERTRKEALMPDMPEFLQRAEMGTIPSLIVALAVGAVLAALFAVPLMRLSGLAAAIATFGVLSISHVVIGNWRAVTAGPGTLVGVPRSATLNVALSCALIAMIVAFVFQRSALGLRLQASREDSVAATAAGINLWRDRIPAFVISGALAALAGGVYGHLFGSLSPDTFYLSMAFLTLTMLIVGGVNSLAGAVMGTLVVSLVSELLLRVETGTSIGGFDISAPAGLRELGLALFLIGILILRPAGITGGKELRWPFYERRQRSSSVGATTESPDAVPPIANPAGSEVRSR